MKAITLCLLAGSLLFSSCIQEIANGTRNNPAADFTLRLNIEETDGTTRQQVSTATNIPGAAEGISQIEVKESKVNLRLGGITFSPNVTLTLSANLRFLQATRPEQIAGEYNLPADADKLLITMGWLRDGTQHFYSPAITGKVKVQYDAATNTWNGELQGIGFNKPLNAPYRSIQLHGRFNHVPFQ